MESRKEQTNATSGNNKIDLQKAIDKMVFWIGTICASISLFAYIIIVTIMVVGFKVSTDITADIIFAVVNAIVGIIIAQFLKVQGVSFAKAEPETKEWLDKWTKRRTKERKYKSMKTYWRSSVTKDILFKGIFIALLTVGTIYIFIEASNDTMKILMALFNIIMFIGFGLVSLANAYNFMKGEHVEWIKVQLEEAERNRTEKEITERKQKNDLFLDNLHGYVLQLYKQYTTAIDTVYSEVTSEEEPEKEKKI